MARKKNKKISVANVLSAFMLLLMAIAMFNFGVMFYNYISEELDENCKVCSYFQDDCPYTDEELLEEEYGGGPCGDMGPYELKFKVGLMFFFGGGFMFLIMAIHLIYYELFSRRQNENKKTY